MIRSEVFARGLLIATTTPSARLLPMVQVCLTGSLYTSIGDLLARPLRRLAQDRISERLDESTGVALRQNQ